ncbi:C40 family peptidase [Streptomyces sp. NPDC020875]|uniref:C40 family peptidase n=1 Tax=Streptomyces sp. NPDC020875 TaxID=3154898 RepID=UPI0033D0E769
MSGKVLRAVCTAALVTAVSLAAVVPGPAARAAGPGLPEGVPELLARLKVLYRDAETAAAAYTAAEERLTAQRVETARLGRELTAARDALAGGRDAAGLLARAQYRGRSDLPSSLRLLLAPDPRAALDEGHLVRRAAADRRATLDRLRDRTARAERLTRESKAALDRERALAAERRTAREAADAGLAAVEEVLAGLTPDEIDGITTPEAQTELTGPEALDTGEPAGQEPGDGPGTESGAVADDGASGDVRPPTAGGERAVRYAVDQLGKPYVWGARGPDAYDCSGLTSRAWSAAGRPIPRTSQEQWRTLPRVPVGELRPGDLVVYFAAATHVGMYVGGGRVVHAPRPGATVKVSPLAANPVLGAVRPDPYAAPLPSYRPVTLPGWAADGDDAGYAETAAP